MALQDIFMQALQQTDPQDGPRAPVAPVYALNPQAINQILDMAAQSLMQAPRALMDSVTARDFPADVGNTLYDMARSPLTASENIARRMTAPQGEGAAAVPNTIMDVLNMTPPGAIEGALAKLGTGALFGIVPGSKAFLKWSRGKALTDPMLGEDLLKYFPDEKTLATIRTGRPVVLPGYHGTDSAFDEFSGSLLGSNTGSKSAEAGVFHSLTPKTAETYAINSHDPNMIPTANIINAMPDADIVNLHKSWGYGLEPAQEYRWNQNKKAWFRRDSDGDYMKIDGNPPIESLRYDIGRYGLRDSNLIEAYTQMIGSSVKPQVRKSFVQFKNPLVVDAKFRQARGESISMKGMVAEAQEQGRDGLIVKNVLDTLDPHSGFDTVFVTFDNKQILSAWAKDEEALAKAGGGQ